MAKHLLTLAFIAIAFAEQPDALVPVTGPQRSLQWGELNFLHTTDVHGWHAGHLLEAQYSADWGDYISFTQRLREKADAIGVDIILVDTGDRIEGNGLYDASSPKGLYTYDIIKALDVDILIPGNHELSHTKSVDNEYLNLVPNFKEKYLASNVDYLDPQTGVQIPLAHRYRVFQTKNQGIKIAAFGFMFNFTNYANNSYVQPVEMTIQEDWFKAVIRENVDLFLICGHIPLREFEFKVIVDAIRSQNKDVPIQVLGAHSHVRDFVMYDSRAYGLQSGRFLETIGWGSISGIKQNQTSNAVNEISFRRRYLDNNILDYHFHSGLNTTTFPTDKGKNVSELMQKARKDLDLDHTYGCTPRDLYIAKSYIPRNDSILTWVNQDILPYVVKVSDRKNTPSMIILYSGFFRHFLSKGPYTRDSVFTSTPYNDKFKYIRNVPYRAARHIVDFLDQNDPMLNSVVNNTAQLTKRDLSTHKNQLSISSDFSRPVLTPGYTTVDDAGSDGDDTLHLPLATYPTPNYIHTSVQLPIDGNPETVSLIFEDYIEKAVLIALDKIGLKFDDSSVMIYEETIITDFIVQWVKENWPCKE